MKQCTCTLVLFLCLALSGCVAMKDPFGAYESRITIEDRRAAAREAVARYDRDARIAEAENAAWAKVSAARTWSWTFPLVVLIAGCSVVATVYIRWNGKVTIARLHYGFFPRRPQPPVLPSDLVRLQHIAMRRNQRIKVTNGVALLVDKETGEVVAQRRLLEG
jgi:hypothetical protein